MYRVAPLSFEELKDAVRTPELLAPAQMFLCNQAHAEIARLETSRGPPAGRFHGVFGPEGLDLVAFFGESRVLVIGPGHLEAAMALEDIATSDERGFRILIGPRPPAQALLDRLRPHVRVELDRSQPFLCVSELARLSPAGPARLGRKHDLDWLEEASLLLNQEDLGVAPHTVDRRLLRRRLRERLEEGRTWVLEVGGRLACKLEVGNEGPAGALIEGVYTEPDLRGRGHARALVAAVARWCLERFPRVGLHVGRANHPALRAYLAVGFEEVEDLELALVHWR